MNAIERFCFGTNMDPEQLMQYLGSRWETSRKEKIRQLQSSLEPLYWQAVRARELGRSHRGFKVGCALLAFRKDARRADRWGIFYGMNTKVEKASRPVCAEPIAVNAAYSSGFDEVIGMVVVGRPQLDEHSGLTCKTLHPCHECRVFLRNHPIVPRHARIITALPPVDDVLPGEDGCEIRTFQQVLRLHGEPL